MYKRYNYIIGRCVQVECEQQRSREPAHNIPTDFEQLPNVGLVEGGVG